MKEKKMKSLMVFLIVALTLMVQFEAQAQLTFGYTSRNDYEVLTPLTLTAVADTGYSTAMTVPSPVLTMIIQINLTSVSASDSLKMELYGSADNTTYTLMSGVTFTQMGATGSQLVTATNLPRYVKIRYYCIGSAISITGTIKAVAKI